MLVHLRLLQRRRQSHHHSTPLFPDTAGLFPFTLPLQRLRQHLIRDADPEPIVGPLGHRSTGPRALLRLLAHHAAEVLPAHERERHARDLAVADGRGGLEGLLQVLLRLDGRVRLDGRADEVVGRLDVLVGAPLAEGFDGRQDAGELGMHWVLRVTEYEDRVEGRKDGGITAWIVPRRFAGRRGKAQNGGLEGGECSRKITRALRNGASGVLHQALDGVGKVITQLFSGLSQFLQRLACLFPVGP